MDPASTFAEKLRRLAPLLQQIETGKDPAQTAAARELIEVLLGLHAEGLRQMLGLSREHRGILEAWSRDPLVSNLLALHGLHPQDLCERVAAALDQWRAPHGQAVAEVELVSVAGEDVRIRLTRGPSADGIPHAALKRSLEDAVLEAAPDLRSLVIEGDVEPPVQTGFVPLSTLLGRP